MANAAMEDTEKLLQIVINTHYRNRPQVVVDGMKAIQNYYNKEQTNTEYDKVLKTLHDLMHDLPPNILLYFLTTVSLPKRDDGTISTLSELIKKSRASLRDNMQAVLRDHLSSVVPPLISISRETATHEENKGNSSKQDPPEKIPEEEPGRAKIESQSGVKNKKLVEICVDYVVTNSSALRKFYNEENKRVWDLIYKNVCNTEHQGGCYQYIQDINRKLEWLRMIEAGHVSVDVIRELYGDSPVFLKEKYLHDIVDNDSFVISKELKDAIVRFINN